MKKRYTKKQIMESIKYWQKQLKMMNESQMPSNPKVQKLLNDIKKLDFDVIKEIKNAAQNDDINPNDEIMDILREFDVVLDKYEDPQHNFTEHWNYQFDIGHIIHCAYKKDYNEAKNIAYSWKRGQYDSDVYLTLLSLYDVLVEVLSKKKYNVVFTAWNRSTLQQDVEASSEEEAKKLIFELNPEEYDQNRDIEIVSIKEEP